MKLNTEKLKNLDFVKIIKESFFFAWQKKYLWWFGLFVSLGSLGTFSPSPDIQQSSENNIPLPENNVILEKRTQHTHRSNIITNRLTI